jgi:hypothetical protein
VFSVGILLRDYVLKFMISMCDFVGILLMDYMLKFMGSMCVFGWNFVEGLCVEIYDFNV